MVVRRFAVVLVSLLLPACGDDGGSGSGSATTLATGADDGSASGTQDGLTVAVDTTAGGTGSGGVLTTGAGTTGADETGDGGLPMQDDCRTAADCVLDDDCCHCAVYGEGLPDGHACANRSCAETTCTAWGIPDPQPICVQGNCLLPKVTCHGSTVVCDEAPPACPGGQAPQIADGCYTQACIPFAACEEFAYFSCDECDAAEVCVRFSSCGGDSCTFSSACLPDPGAAVVNCATAGDVLCNAFGPGYACYDEATGPYCCTGESAACTAAG